MLFNSYIFIFVFLPMTLCLFCALGTRGHYHAAIATLVGASLFFYAWWNPIYLALLLFSILFNFGTGRLLSVRASRGILAGGITMNLALLGYFKYANFFVDNLNALTHTGLKLAPIMLPLAISFFTFQQITFLVDSYRGQTREYRFLHYGLFVSFFPQLIAGPIVHHSEMLPQFARPEIYRFDVRRISLGLSIFLIGLFKKVMLADEAALYATPVFSAALQGDPLSFGEAWLGALAYTFQIYFDFSGYSDMAIGLAQMFGIRLPLNFFSPYKATSIIEFWRRWHMTLSRFLMNYIYIPLGGNRKGSTRRYLNLLVTMLLGGLWHGAGWTYILWGALHGGLLIINNLWLSARRALGLGDERHTWWGKAVAWTLTFTAIVYTMVVFRCESVAALVNMTQALSGATGLALPAGFLEGEGLREIRLLILLALITWGLPNVQQLFAAFEPALDIYRGASPAYRLPWLSWRPTPAWAGLVGLMGLIAILSCTRASEFLYFQF